MQKFEYMMLGRMMADCEYFLGHGNGCEKYLYSLSVEEHIKDMKDLWNKLKIKPEWLSMDDINNFEIDMLKYIKDKY